MSTKHHSSEDMYGLSSITSTATGKVPALVAGAGGRDYVIWRAAMQSFMMKVGSIRDEDYKKELVVLPYGELVKNVQEWREEEEKEAMSFIMQSSVSSLVGALKVEKLTLEEEEVKKSKAKGRKLFTDMLERIQKAYSILYAALNEDLKLLANE